MRKYGWTAKQYARANARQSDPNRMKNYSDEYSKRDKKSAFEENPEKPKRRFPEEDENETRTVRKRKSK